MTKYPDSSVTSSITTGRRLIAFENVFQTSPPSQLSFRVWFPSFHVAFFSSFFFNTYIHRGASCSRKFSGLPNNLRDKQSHSPQLLSLSLLNASELINYNTLREKGTLNCHFLQGATNHTVPRSEENSWCCVAHRKVYPGHRLLRRN